MIFLPFFLSSSCFLKSNYTAFQTLLLTKKYFYQTLKCNYPFSSKKANIHKNLVTSAIFLPHEQVDYKNGETSSLSGETKQKNLENYCHCKKFFPFHGLLVQWFLEKKKNFSLSLIRLGYGFDPCLRKCLLLLISYVFRGFSKPMSLWCCWKLFFFLVFLCSGFTTYLLTAFMHPE